MKKLTAVMFSLVILLTAASAWAVVPSADAYMTIVDWPQMTQDKLNGGGEVSAFADLTYWSVSSAGTQNLQDGRFVINVEEGEFNNCYQFSLDNAVNDGNKSAWSKSSGLRFYLENNTGGEFAMTLNLYIQSAEVGYNRPYNSGSGVSFVLDNGSDYEPDFRSDDSFADRYFYVPEDFKGWVIIPATFAEDQSDVYAGWLPTVWSIAEEGFDFSIASMDIVGGMGFDIRADEITSGSIVFGNLELCGEDESLFVKPDEKDVLKAPDNTPESDVTNQPSSSATGATNAPTGTAEPDTGGAGLPVWAIALIAAGAAAVIAVIIIVAVKASKKKNK